MFSKLIEKSLWDALSLQMLILQLSLIYLRGDQTGISANTKALFATASEAFSKIKLTIF